ncbi:hypothetical protein [Gallaecimonas sp. GXIMD4217]|uniref:hypothetical protein n=1 Tax=Gallaecimonas sp. GXIMD4217 TaxID=3131927 RepID=UPI00311AE6A0
MNRKNEDGKQPSLAEQLAPTDMGLLQSMRQSRALLIMLLVFAALFGGFALFLLKMAA